MAGTGSAIKGRIEMVAPLASLVRVASGFRLQPRRKSTGGLAAIYRTELDRRDHQRFGTAMDLSGDEARRVAPPSSPYFRGTLAGGLRGVFHAVEDNLPRCCHPLYASNIVNLEVTTSALATWQRRNNPFAPLARCQKRNGAFAPGVCAGPAHRGKVGSGQPDAKVRLHIG